MATSLTQDEYPVLQQLLSGKGIEEIAAILHLPLQVVRTCVHTLIARVLDELEPYISGPARPSVWMPAAPSVGIEKQVATPPPALARTPRSPERQAESHGEPVV